MTEEEVTRWEATGERIDAARRDAEKRAEEERKERAEAIRILADLENGKAGKAAQKILAEAKRVGHAYQVKITALTEPTLAVSSVWYGPDGYHTMDVKKGAQPIGVSTVLLYANKGRLSATPQAMSETIRRFVNDAQRSVDVRLR